MQVCLDVFLQLELTLLLHTAPLLPHVSLAVPWMLIMKMSVARGVELLQEDLCWA